MSEIFKLLTPRPQGEPQNLAVARHANGRPVAGRRHGRFKNLRYDADTHIEPIPRSFV
jgi:hypothetical protein